MNNVEMINLLKHIDLVKSGVEKFQGTKKYIATGSLETEGITDYEIVDYDSKPSRANMQFKENDIIFAKMKDTEKVFLIDKDSSKNIYSTGFAGLRIKDQSKFNPKYVYYWIRSSKFQIEKNKRCTGATQKAINNNNIKNLTIPLISLSAQKELIIKLEYLDNLIYYNKQSIELIDKYLDSVFNKLFGDIVKNPQWELKELETVSNIIMGQSPPGKSYNEHGEGMEFFQGKGEFGDIYPTVEKWTTSPSKIAQPNDILFSVRAPVGSVNIANIKCCIGRGLSAIEPKDELNYIYLYYYFKLMENVIASRGAGSTFKSITKKQLSSLLIPVPPITIQNKFYDIFVKVQQIKSQQKETEKYLNDLFNNLMDNNFKGEI